jgi:biotin carboxyl carrier protein
MPGLVVGVPAKVGEPVKMGQGVVILEAMKMENEIRAPRDGVVKAVRVAPGQAVEQGQVLAVIG